MNKNPEIQMADVIVTSPYYNRIHALKMERDFAPIGSPNRQWIEGQISEMTRRALGRMQSDQNITMP